MSSLTDKKLKDTYKGVLKTTGDNSELDSNYKRVTDGNGNDSGVELKGTSSGDVRFGGKIQAQGNIEKVDGGGSVTGTYKTETENDSRYLQSVPAEFVTQTEGDARYLQGVPAEFLTETEGDARYSQIGSAETNDLTQAVVWSNVPDGNITQSSVTQHQASINITESQISDLQAYLTAVPSEFLTETEGDARYPKAFTSADTDPSDRGYLPTTGYQNTTNVKPHYSIIIAHGTNIQNAQAFLDEYKRIKDVQTATNRWTSNFRYTIYLSTGHYDFRDAGITFGGVALTKKTVVIDENFIDIRSLSGNCDINIQAGDGNSDGLLDTNVGFHITASDVRLSGLELIQSRFRTNPSTSTNKYEKIKAYRKSFGYKENATGDFTECEVTYNASTDSFGFEAVASGNFIDCYGGNESFAKDGTASGRFTRCEGGQRSFGGGDGNGNSSSGNFFNCEGGNLSFGGANGGANGTASGHYYRCRAYDLFNNAHGSFGGQNGTFSGKAFYCIAGKGSFGGSGYDYSGANGGGAFTGEAYYCVVMGTGGFGGNGTGTNYTGTAFYCVAGDNSFADRGSTNTPSGKALQCVENNSELTF